MSWFFVVTIALLSLSSFAKPANSCRFVYLLNGPDVYIDGQIRGELELTRRAFLQSNGNSTFFWDEPMPSSFQLGKKTYTVIERLGAGDGGEIFLVKLDGNLKVIKQYRKNKNVLKELALLEEHRSAGYETLQFLEVDTSNNVAIFPFVYGMDVRAILWKQNWNYLSEQTKAYIENAFEQFIDRHDNRVTRHLLPLRQNVLLDFSTGRFVVIDHRR